MIFVTVGTQPNGFLRCLVEVERLIEKYNITEEVIAQIGNTDFKTDKFKTVRIHMGKTNLRNSSRIRLL